jgi:hypothetical protein
LRIVFGKAGQAVASNWAPLPDKKGISRGDDDWIMSVSCGKPPKVQLSLGPKNEVLGAIIKEARLDGMPVLNGKGWNLGLDFVSHLSPKPHFELSNPPLT